MSAKKLFVECFRIVKSNEDKIDTAVGCEAYETMFEMSDARRFFEEIGHPITDREKTAAVIAYHNRERWCEA